MTGISISSSSSLYASAILFSLLRLWRINLNLAVEIIQCFGQQLIDGWPFQFTEPASERRDRDRTQSMAFNHLAQVHHTGLNMLKARYVIPVIFGGQIDNVAAIYPAIPVF